MTLPEGNLNLQGEFRKLHARVANAEAAIEAISVQLADVQAHSALSIPSLPRFEPNANDVVAE